MQILKEQSEFLVTLKKGGVAAVATDIDFFEVPFACTLAREYIRFATAGTKPGDASTNVTVDIRKNGTSLLSTLVGFAGAISPAVSGVFLVDPPVFAKNDVIRIDIATIFNGTSPTQPTDLTVDLVLVRLGTPPAAVSRGFVLDE